MPAGRKLDAYARHLGGRREAERDVDGMAGGGAAARQRVRVGDMEEQPWTSSVQ